MGCLGTDNFLPPYFQAQKCLEIEKGKAPPQGFPIRVAGGAGCKFIKIQGESMKRFPPITPFKRLFWTCMLKLESYLNLNVLLANFYTSGFASGPFLG